MNTLELRESQEDSPNIPTDLRAREYELLGETEYLNRILTEEDPDSEIPPGVDDLLDRYRDEYSQATRALAEVRRLMAIDESSELEAIAQ